MLFNSLAFAVFFPVVTAIYFILPHRYRWVFLLIASCFFYMYYIPVYILILFTIIAIDFTAGLAIERTAGVSRKSLLLVSLATNLGVLFFFKYFNFAAETLQSVLNLASFDIRAPLLNFLLPIGLSFHTFQAMSYTIEVYRGNQPAERHLGIYALYVMFYPQLVAGPVERPQNLLFQFRTPVSLDYERITWGLKRMAMGFFKKVVIADRLTVIVNQVYETPDQFRGLAPSMAIFAFALQIYCDFSGYSDIAIGAAQVMGIRLMENFNDPYSSLSISEFWRRWHISLSTWFRDYLYVPLGGNRVTKNRWYFNLFVVFTLSGLWHGASWNYVVWGFLHASYLIISLIIRPEDFLAPIPAWLRRAWTFLLVCIAWVFFRAKTLSEATLMISATLKGLFDLTQSRHGQSWAKYLGLDTLLFSKPEWLAVGASIVFLELYHYYQRKEGFWEFIRSLSAWVRGLFYYAFLLWILFWGNFDANSFIYFQF